MSAIEASCYAIPPEKQSGAGEMTCYKPQTVTTSQAIASEIMNEIVDNAFEVIMGKSLQQPSKVEKITPNVVGDILDNILSPSSNNDETVLLDDEIKKIIKEMKFPSDSKLRTQGVGDQLTTESEVAPDKIPTEPVKRNTLERKTRLTNLVKNSKQMLAKLISDNDNDVRRLKSEELLETVIKVIDLEAGGNVDEKHNVQGTSRAEPGLLNMPRDSKMEMINLEPHIQKTSTDQEEEEETEISSCSLVKLEDKKNATVNKKKWNIGAKILKYLKRKKN